MVDSPFSCRGIGCDFLLASSNHGGPEDILKKETRFLGTAWEFDVTQTSNYDSDESVRRGCIWSTYDQDERSVESNKIGYSAR
jgi:hypothetical protein